MKIKNNEHYQDPTAEIAIRHVMNEMTRKLAKIRSDNIKRRIEHKSTVMSELWKATCVQNLQDGKTTVKKLSLDPKSQMNWYCQTIDKKLTYIVSDINNMNKYARFIATYEGIPIVSHIMYQDIFGDAYKTQEFKCKLYSLVILSLCDTVTVFTINNTISDTMRQEIDLANKLKIPITYYNTFDDVGSKEFSECKFTVFCRDKKKPTVKFSNYYEIVNRKRGGEHHGTR